MPRRFIPQAKPYAANIEIFDTDGNPKELSDYGQTSSEPTADVAGEWALMLDFQGQELPITLTLTQDGDIVSGELSTMLGTGKIESGKVRGSKISATASTEMQGNAMEFVITGAVDGDSMNGTISAPIVPEPLSFTGTRSKNA